MKFSLGLCVLLGVAVAANAGIPIFGDMMKSASDGMKQAMGAMGGGNNPFMKAIEDAQKMVEGGGGDALKQMQAMLEKGLQEASGGDMQKQFQDALAKMQQMAGEGANPEAILSAIQGAANPFMSAMEEAKKMLESGGGDGPQQMMALLEKGMKEAANGDLQKQFEQAISKAQQMIQEGAPNEKLLAAMQQMMQQG